MSTAPNIPNIEGEAIIGFFKGHRLQLLAVSNVTKETGLLEKQVETI